MLKIVASKPEDQGAHDSSKSLHCRKPVDGIRARRGEFYRHHLFIVSSTFSISIEGCQGARYGLIYDIRAEVEHRDRHSYDERRRHRSSFVIGKNVIWSDSFFGLRKGFPQAKGDQTHEAYDQQCIDSWVRSRQVLYVNDPGKYQSRTGSEEHNADVV